MQSPAVKKDTWPESVVVWVSTGAVVVWLPLQQIKNSTQPESGRRLGGGWAWLVGWVPKSIIAKFCAPFILLFLLHAFRCCGKNACEAKTLLQCSGVCVR